MVPARPLSVLAGVSEGFRATLLEEERPRAQSARELTSWDNDAERRNSPSPRVSTEGLTVGHPVLVLPPWLEGQPERAGRGHRMSSEDVS